MNVVQQPKTAFHLLMISVLVFMIAQTMPPVSNQHIAQGVSQSFAQAQFFTEQQNQNTLEKLKSITETKKSLEPLYAAARRAKIYCDSAINIIENWQAEFREQMGNNLANMEVSRSFFYVEHHAQKIADLLQELKHRLRQNVWELSQESIPGAKITQGQVDTLMHYLPLDETIWSATNFAQLPAALADALLNTLVADLQATAHIAINFCADKFCVMDIIYDKMDVLIHYRKGGFGSEPMQWEIMVGKPLEASENQQFILGYWVNGVPVPMTKNHTGKVSLTPQTLGEQSYIVHVLVKTGNEKLEWLQDTLYYSVLDTL